MFPSFLPFWGDLSRGNVGGKEGKASQSLGKYCGEPCAGIDPEAKGCFVLSLLHRGAQLGL